MDEQNINPTPSKFNFNKVFASIGIILIVIIIISVGIWNLVQNAEDKASKIDETTPITVATTSAKPKNTTSSAIPADWKTYLNSKYNYSFKYSKDLSVSSGVEGLPGNENLRQIDTTAVINLGNGSTTTILQVTVIAETKSLNQVKQDLLSDTTAKVLNMSDTTASSIPALKFSYNGYLSVTCVKQGYRYDFYLANETRANLVLSTFKFL